jgi:hypothetical protein
LALLSVPLHQLLRYLRQAVRALKKLEQSGKSALAVEGPGFRSALEQEYGLMARLIGMILAVPILGLAFQIASIVMGNGWWLSVLAGLPIYLAEISAWLELKLGRWTYNRSLKRLWRQAIVLSSDAW